jgi:hypothetical protein
MFTTKDVMHFERLNQRVESSPFKIEIKYDFFAVYPRDTEHPVTRGYADTRLAVFYSYDSAVAWIEGYMARVDYENMAGNK